MRNGRIEMRLSLVVIGMGRRGKVRRLRGRYSRRHPLTALLMRLALIVTVVGRLLERGSKSSVVIIAATAIQWHLCMIFGMRLLVKKLTFLRVGCVVLVGITFSTGTSDANWIDSKTLRCT